MNHSDENGTRPGRCLAATVAVGRKAGSRRIVYRTSVTEEPTGPRPFGTGTVVPS
jgi:hypothetical protein